MDWSERDVEDYLVAHPEVIGCDQILGRQVNVGVGIIDILAYRNQGRKSGPSVVVVEIKKDQIDCDAVGQLSRYMAAIREPLLSWSIDAVFGLRLQGLLVGSSIDTDALNLCEDLGFHYWQYELQVVVRADYRVLRPLGDRMDEDRQRVLLSTVSQLGDWVRANTPDTTGLRHRSEVPANGHRPHPQETD